MFRKPSWHRTTDPIAQTRRTARGGVGTTTRETDLAALEPRLLFSAGPIPLEGAIEGDIEVHDVAADVGEIAPLPNLPGDSLQRLLEESSQGVSVDVNPPLPDAAATAATLDKNLLSASEVDTTPEALTRAITSSSGDGSFEVPGTLATTFTQEDIDLGRVTDEDSESEATADRVDFQLDDGQGARVRSEFEVSIAALNQAPVLSDTEVALDPISENAGAPVGAVGTLVSELVDLTPASQSVQRTDVVPFYAASGGDASRRSINWWWEGWDEWATKVKVSLEQHGSFWMHLPYGTVGVHPMDFDGQSDAANGVPGVHGPLPHIAEGLEHYLEQVVTPSDELFFYFGAPSTIYTDGMTYAEYETAVLAELDDVLGLADDAKVSIGFDATYGQPTSLGGIWTVLGGPTGYNARVLEKVASFGVNIILEPWIYQGATWAYDYDTIYTDRFYRSQGLDEGAVPLASHIYASSEVLTGDHYRLPFQTEVDLHYGGSWETAAVEILASGDVPLTLMLNDASTLFENAWSEFADDVIDPSTLDPLPGYDPPGNNSIDELTLIEGVSFSSLFGEGAAGIPTGNDAVDVTPAAVFDNVHDVDSLLTGIAITGANTTNGAWWYSTDGGQTWDELGSVTPNSARLLAANSLTRLYFEPNANYNGDFADGLTFQAWDRSDETANGTAGVDVSSGGGSSAFSAASDQIAVSVTGVNHAPTIGTLADQVATEDVLLGPLTLTIGDVDTPVTSLNVTAVSSDPATIPNEHISISGTGASRSLTLLSAANQHGGPVTITVTVSDGQLTAEEQFDVSVLPQQDTPQAVDDSYVAEQDETLNISVPGPLGNDTDLDDDPLTMVIVSQPQHGTLLAELDGSLSYTPAPAFTGTDSFQYVANDGVLSSLPATVRILVQPTVAPPPPVEPPPSPDPPPPPEVIPPPPEAVLPPPENTPPPEDVTSLPVVLALPPPAAVPLAALKTPAVDRVADNADDVGARAELSPIRQLDPLLSVEPLPLEALTRQRVLETTASVEPPAGAAESPVDPTAVEAPIVPRRTAVASPLVPPTDTPPISAASELPDPVVERRPVRVELSDAENRSIDLDHNDLPATELQQLADDVALGVSSTLTAGYALWLARGTQVVSSVLQRLPFGGVVGR